MPAERSAEKGDERLISFEGKSIDLIHDEQVEILRITVKLMRRQDDAIPFESPCMLAIYGYDAIRWESILEAVVELDNDVAPRQSEANMVA